MLSKVQETTSTSSIVGRCCVLEYLDYSTRRATEIQETDVFICESVYDEMKKQLNKISQPGAIRKFTHSHDVTPDEIYHFKRAITPQKDMKIENGELVCINDTSAAEDELDTSLPDTPNNSIISIPTTPQTTGRNKPGGRHNRGKVVTGYILYSSEQRKERCEVNPGATFGEISRMLGDEWRSMEQKERSFWEDKAAKLNEAAKQKWKEDNAHLINQPPDPNTLTPGQGFLQNRENPIPNQVRVLYKLLSLQKKNFMINFHQFRFLIAVGRNATFNLKTPLTSLTIASPRKMDVFKNTSIKLTKSPNFFVYGAVVSDSNVALPRFPIQLDY